jgi:ElaA protein
MSAVVCRSVDSARRTSPVRSHDNVAITVVDHPPIHRRRFADLSARELHDLVRLRIDVFVVEQDCPYSDLDGRDLEPETEHCWIEVAGATASYLRVLRDPDGGWRLGRVVTDPAHRGRALAGTLITAVLPTIGRPVVLHAQAHLSAWYERFGFVVEGAEFLEDGIPHVPMVLR